MWLKVTLTTLTLAYPWLCYYGSGHFLAWFMLVMWLLRALFAKTHAIRWGALAVAGFFAILAFFFPEDQRALFWYPLLINAGLLFVFASSLFSKQTVIERLARLQEPDLPPAGVCYTRKVTQIWCAFFIFNGAIIAGLSFLEDKTAWTLYTGVISYLLIGLLLAAEWLYRHYKLKK